MKKNIDPLTIAVYKYIHEYRQRERRSPSLREIGSGCGLSHSGVLPHLARLEGLGWIEREFGIARSICLGEFAPHRDQLDN
jgi:DNA-binding MarR family transcriptional regulator